MKLYLLTLWMFMNPNWSSLNAVLFLWRCFYFCSEATDFHIQHAKLPHPKPPAAPLCLPERRKINPHISAVLLPGRLCGPITQAPAVSFWPGENSTQPGLHGWMEGLGGGIDVPGWRNVMSFAGAVSPASRRPAPSTPDLAENQDGESFSNLQRKNKKILECKGMMETFSLCQILPLVSRNPKQRWMFFSQS